MTHRPTPEQILARAPRSRPSTAGPIRKDEIELHDRGVYIESWLPERRSRRKPLLFVHGELAGSWVWERYLGYFAARGWEGHALNLRNHYWSQTADPTTLSFDTYTEDVVASIDRSRAGAVVRRPRDGRPARAQGRRADADRRLVLLSSELPRELRVPAPSARAARDPRRLRTKPIGWETLPERLLRDDRDLTLADVLRIQHLLGRSRTRPAPRGARCSPACRSTGASLARCRRSSSVRARPELTLADTERLAEWLDAGTSRSARTRTTAWSSARRATSRSPKAIRAFLETNRL